MMAVFTRKLNAFDHINLSGFVELQIQQDDNEIVEYTEQTVLIENQYVQVIK